MTRKNRFSSIFTTCAALFALSVFIPIDTCAQESRAATTPQPPQTRPRTVMTPAASPSPTPRPVTPSRPATPIVSPTPLPPSTVTPSSPRLSTPITVIPSPQTSISPVVAAPTSPVVQPRPLTNPLSPNRIDTRIEEAERLLRTRTQLTGQTGTPNIFFVTLAVLDADSSRIHTLTLPKEIFLTRGSEVTLAPQTMSALVRVRIVRANGVNTAVTVFDPATGRQFIPLVVEYPIERGGQFREMAYYTSAHPALLSSELVSAGQTYVRTMLDLAAERLRLKNFVVSPQIIDVAERLSIVEHVDHDRFRREDRRALYNEIYSLYALNRLDTYRYSVSFAGAGGMVQMIPSTYQMIRRRRPAVGLNPEFVPGMRNHGNALEAMLVYMQDTWNDMILNPDVAYAFNSRLATQAELLAAGYNSNPARLGGYIQRGNSAWRTLIPRETQMYLQIYRSFESLVPLRARATANQSAVNQ